jgi:glycosyltransferase involved in cell wall biosynthesis
MKVVVVRRVRGSTPSIDIYADNLVAALRSVRPEWVIQEIEPKPWNTPDKLWMSGTGIRKYYERFLRYPQEVCQLQADIFHIIDHTDAHIARWLRKRGKKVVVTCHDLVQFIQPEKQSRFSALSLAAWRFSVKGMCQADHVIAVSSNTAKDVQKFLNIPSAKVTTALNGVESNFRELPSDAFIHLRPQNEVPFETICILNVGGTHQRKNILTVLKVLENLRSQGLSVCLWKTGSQFTIEQKAFILEYRLEQCIVHWGNPDKDILVSLYNAADLLLSPSLYEGFGLTIVEAMACGTPVVTSNLSSIPEVTGNAAILLEPTDVTGIVNAIINLKLNPAYRQELSNKGLIRSKFFKWERTAEKIINVYKQVLDSN